MSDQPAFLPDLETGMLSPDVFKDLVKARDLNWKPHVWLTSRPVPWEPGDTCPRTLSSRVSLLEARERLAAGVMPVKVRPGPRLRLWLLWLAVALPVAVALVWRWL